MHAVNANRDVLDLVDFNETFVCFVHPAIPSDELRCCEALQNTWHHRDGNRTRTHTTAALASGSGLFLFEGSQGDPYGRSSTSGDTCCDYEDNDDC